MSNSEVQGAIQMMWEEMAQREIEKREKKTKISVNIDEMDKKKLEYISDYLDVGISELVRTILSSGLCDAERTLDLKIIEEKDGENLLTKYGQYLGYDKLQSKES